MTSTPAETPCDNVRARIDQPPEDAIEPMLARQRLAARQVESPGGTAQVT